MSEADSVHLDVCELAERLPGCRAVVVEGAEDYLTLLVGGGVAGEQDAGLLEEEGDAAVGVSRGVDDAGAQAGRETTRPAPLSARRPAADLGSPAGTTSRIIAQRWAGPRITPTG